MTSDQFDALARALTLRSPRRSALAALLGAAMPTVAYAVIVAECVTVKEEILRYIRRAARKYGQSRRSMIRVAL